MIEPSGGRRGMAVDPGRRPARAPRARAAIAVVSALLGGGCDHFRVESFHGSKVLFSLLGATPTQPGHHVELWARESRSPDDQRVSRLAVEGRRPDGTPCATDENCPKSAYVITQAVAFTGSGPSFALTDGCMIDALGNLQWSKEAYTDLTPPQCNCQPRGTAPRSRPQTPDLSHSNGPQGQLGADAVMRRIHQITDLAPTSPLLVFASYDDGAGERPAVDDPKLVSPSVRLQACCDYWCASPFAYSGNVIQTTAPIHGALYGTLEFSSVQPAQLLGGVALSVDYALHDIVELWLTDTTASVTGLDPLQLDCGSHPKSCAGDVFVDGTLSKASDTGRGLLHFDLTPPHPGGPSGAAVVQVRLDEDSSQL